MDYKHKHKQTHREVNCDKNPKKKEFQVKKFARSRTETTELQTIEEFRFVGQVKRKHHKIVLCL